jgi:hypothetical protein
MPLSLSPPLWRQVVSGRQLLGHVSAVLARFIERGKQVPCVLWYV